MKRSSGQKKLGWNTVTEYTDQLTAEQLIAYIASDYIELSHDKAVWQRDDWRKACRSWLDKNTDERWRV